jgi:hypothetical protein
MAKERDGISTGAILIGAIAVLALFGVGMYVSSTMNSGPEAPEKIQLAAIEPAPAPPDAPELSERVRVFFMKGNAEECMERHLGRDQRLEGQLAIELLPEGKTSNGEAKTEPPNGGVALCVQQRFANGFVFKGPPQRVSYNFTARWESGRIALGQNVTTSAR